MKPDMFEKPRSKEIELSGGRFKALHGISTSRFNRLMRSVRRPKYSERNIA